MHKVCIAISTYGERINSIALPNPLFNVSYLIIHQDPKSLADSVQEKLQRQDVSYISLKSKGLSISRNTALSYATADYIHIMDDDVDINPQNILKLATLASAEGVDVAIGYFHYESGRTSKNYGKSKKLNIRDFFSVCSIEMCIKSRTVTNTIFFDENFGLGTSKASGEEFIYLSDVYMQKQLIKYYPLSVGTHPEVTSGDDFFSSTEKILAKREMLERAFPKISYLLKILFFVKKYPILLKKKKAYEFFKVFFKKTN